MLDAFIIGQIRKEQEGREPLYVEIPGPPENLPPPDGRGKEQDDGDASPEIVDLTVFYFRNQLD